MNLTVGVGADTRSQMYRQAGMWKWSPCTHIMHSSFTSNIMSKKDKIIC
jgi:hypothetical protein